MTGAVARKGRPQMSNLLRRFVYSHFRHLHILPILSHSLPLSFPCPIFHPAPLSAQSDKQET